MNSNTTLSYSTPAFDDDKHISWVRALPVGNGRLGGMVFGRTEKERIQLNEITIWTGAPIDYSNEKGADNFKKIRELMIAGDQKGASEIAKNCLIANPFSQSAYQPFVDLFIDFGHLSENVSDYIRTLDTENSIATVDYKYKGISYHRETIASYPNQLLATHITSTGEKTLQFTLELKLPELEGKHANQTHKGSGKYYLAQKISENQISLKARVQDGEKTQHNGGGGINNQTCKVDFEARALVDTDGQICATNDTISVVGASYATVYAFGATNFIDYKTLGETDIRTKRNDFVISKIYNGEKFIKNYQAIKNEHQSDYKSLNGRNSIEISSHTKSCQTEKTTDDRILEFDGNNDIELVNLYYNYAKYLVISSSRSNDNLDFGNIDNTDIPVIVKGQPSTLQGLWNYEYCPDWQSQYTININIQMIYWLSQLSNINETEKPFFDAIQDLMESGHNTSVKTYGIGKDNNAWVAHHNSDLWRGTAPVEYVNAGQWPSGHLWVAYHLWERYLYSMDEEFLRNTAYPALKGCVEFSDEYMTEAVGKDGKTYLVSAVSISPEHGGLQIGPAMDQQLIRQTYKSLIKASKILNIDSDLCVKWENTLSRVAPDFISSSQFEGKPFLQEWFYDIDEEICGASYSHTSQLWGLYPGVETNVYDKDQEEMFCAYKNALIRRMSGGGGTGWATAWRQALCARALLTDKAYQMFCEVISQFTAPNMMDLIMPYHHFFKDRFQLDANIGCASAVIEMLIQSHDGVITLFPAIPNQWENIKAKGIIVRGGFSVDINYDKNSTKQVQITPKKSGEVLVRCMSGIHNVSVVCNGKAIDINFVENKENVFSFMGDSDKAYVVSI